MRERNVTKSPTREVGIEGEDQEISIIPVGSHLSEFSRGTIPEKESEIVVNLVQDPPPIQDVGTSNVVSGNGETTESTISARMKFWRANNFRATKISIRES